VPTEPASAPERGRGRGGRALFSLATTAAIAITACWLALPDPLIEEERFIHYPDAVAVTDRTGVPLRFARSGEADRRWVPLASISQNLVDAVLALEDARFREHSGVDVRATARAVLWAFLPGRPWSGGSTITQQLVKLVYGRPHGVASKGVEIARAIALERTFSKDEILEQYLNRLPYGNGIVGVGRASEAYFGHSASELTLSEAALLAGIPQAPSATEPRRHLPRAMRRRSLALSRLRALRWRAPTEIDAAEREEIRIVAAPPRAWRAPRFVDAVLRERARGAIVGRGGRIATSLDAELQDAAEAALRARVLELAPRGVGNGAAIVVAASTGEVLAYVGAARSGADAPGGELDLLRARRQPGSTLKPFVYELLFERGGTAATILDDMATPMTGASGTLYAPRDFDGAERGPVRARAALAGSLNLAALDAARRVGADRIVDRLGALGIDEVPPASEVGPAVVLGGAGVRAIELAEAYATLARGGTRVPLRLAPAAVAEGERVMEPGAAEIARDVLFDGRARAQAFGSDLRREADGRDFGLKTGTSTGFRDAWAVAFDDHFVVVVWLGDPSGRPLAGVSGFEGAAPVAARLLASAHAREGSLGAAIAADVREPPDLVSLAVCARTGLLAGARCPDVALERFVPGTAPTRTCDEALAPDGAWLLAPRYADWIDRTRPAGMRIRSHDERSVSVAAAPVVAYPRAGARLTFDATRGETRLPLRATLAGATVASAWEIDGRPWQEPTWPMTRGEHHFVALFGGARSEAAHIVVE
jgi:penicillin-binding protein 1C